jgi:hypothetical protein
MERHDVAPKRKADISTPGASTWDLTSFDTIRKACASALSQKQRTLFVLIRRCKQRRIKY